MKKKPKKLAINKYLNVIDKIENIRGTNNINWMNILRIAFTHSPVETKKIVKKLILKILESLIYLENRKNKFL